MQLQELSRKHNKRDLQLMLSSRDPKMVNATLKLLILIFLILKPHGQLKSKGVLLLIPNVLPVYPGKNQKPLRFQKEEMYVWIIPSLSAFFRILQVSRISKQETLWGENKDEISSQPFVVMQFSTCLKFIYELSVSSTCQVCTV